MKRLLFTILLFTAALPAAAQLYHPGEQLFYRVSYKAKMFPNTEVGAVEVKTSEVQLDDRKFYKVEGIGRTSYDDDSFSHDCSKAPYPALNALKFTPHFICFSATFQLFPVIYGAGLPKARPNSRLKSWYSQKGPDSQCGNPVPFNPCLTYYFASMYYFASIYHFTFMY